MLTTRNHRNSLKPSEPLSILQTVSQTRQKQSQMRLLYTAPELYPIQHIAQSLKHLGVAVLLKPQAHPNTYLCENVRARDHSRLELKASQRMRKRKKRECVDTFAQCMDAQISILPVILLLASGFGRRFISIVHARNSLAEKCSGLKCIDIVKLSLLTIMFKVPSCAS